MPIEIERKFLLRSDAWRALADAGTRYRQGYLAITDRGNVRVRCSGQRAFLTIKGRAQGTGRAEFEYEIPVADAEEMLSNLCIQPIIDKTRYLVRVGELLWEIDEFHGENEGLIVAEVELKRPDQPVDPPPWIGREVTGESRYYNASLVGNPYRNWR
jgi:adenylate cyclase